MEQCKYSVVSETTEDCFGESDSFTEALRIARLAIRESLTGDTILIERSGRVVRQLVRTSEGVIVEETVAA